MEVYAFMKLLAPAGPLSGGTKGSSYPGLEARVRCTLCTPKGPRDRQIRAATLSDCKITKEHIQLAPNKDLF